MSEEIRVLISEEEIEERIREMGRQISEFYQGEPGERPQGGRIFHL